MKALNKLILAILVSMSVNACASQGDRVRTKANELCQDVKLPSDAIVRDGERISQKGRAYILQDRYISLLGHSSQLSSCAERMNCAVRWTEWERDCQAQENKLIRLLFGYKTSCDIPKPGC